MYYQISYTTAENSEMEAIRIKAGNRDEALVKADSFFKERGIETISLRVREIKPKVYYL